MSDETGLRAIIGRNVERLRLERDWRQEDLSRGLRHWGLPWSRSRVAEVEAGTRPISLEALLLLARTLEVQQGGERLKVKLSEFFVGSERVALSSRAEMQLADLRDALAGGDVVLGLKSDTARDVHAQMVGAARRFAERWEALPDVLKQIDMESLDAMDERPVTESERRAAKSLDVDVMAIGLASHLLWGTSFEDERDARASTRAEEMAGDPALEGSARELRAVRGRVTRELQNEIREFLASPQGGA